MKDKNKPKVTAVPKDVPFGLVLWQCPSGNYLGNANGEFLCVGVHMGDLSAAKERIERLRREATILGYGDGQPVFRPGMQKVTQSEWEDQMEQLIDGKPVEGDIE